MSRIHWTQRAPTLFYQGKASNDDPQLSLFDHPDGESLDVFEFLDDELCLSCPSRDAAVFLNRIRAPSHPPDAA